jgi:hypothetical protein
MQSSASLHNFKGLPQTSKDIPFYSGSGSQITERQLLAAFCHRASDAKGPYKPLNKLRFR